MLQVICYTLIFIMGTFFGSFFTLAVYRIPLGKDITHEHSFCPNCGNKLKTLDLIPIFSYVFLGGKCRYCGQKIKIRYLCLEILSGITFLLLALSMNFDFESLETSKYISFTFLILYFSTLFIIAGIDKEKKSIQRSVLLFGFIVEVFYMIYLCIVEKNIVYRYIIYLVVMFVFLLLDTLSIRKMATSKYSLQILILSTYMIIFTGEYGFLLTVFCTSMAICIYKMMKKIKQRRVKYKVEEKKEKLPIGFYLCVSNVIFVLLINFLTNCG